MDKFHHPDDGEAFYSILCSGRKYMNIWTIIINYANKVFYTYIQCVLIKRKPGRKHAHFSET